MTLRPNPEQLVIQWLIFRLLHSDPYSAFLYIKKKN